MQLNKPATRKLLRAIRDGYGYSELFFAPDERLAGRPPGGTQFLDDPPVGPVV
jgi:hypothetical protein